MNNIHWFGKLPSQPEFLTSKTNPDIEASFNTWILQGQNHIGQRLLPSQGNLPLYCYAFSLVSLSVSRLYGVLLTSHDSVGRPYPFIIYSMTLSPSELSHAIRTCFDELTIDFAQFYQSFSAEAFYSAVQQALTNLITLEQSDANKDFWIEAYPTLNQLSFSAEKMTPILFRKLTVRE